MKKLIAFCAACLVTLAGCTPGGAESTAPETPVPTPPSATPLSTEEVAATPSPTPLVESSAPVVLPTESLPPETTPPAPTECPHSYSETASVPAGCESAGSKTFTCSLCGQSYTETIPATGHQFNGGQTCAVCGANNPDYQQQPPTNGTGSSTTTEATTTPPTEEQVPAA